jgi:uncharacterized membrane protein HdeD (DUF308 family)
MRGLVSVPVFLILGAILVLLGVALLVSGSVGSGAMPLVLGLLAIARGIQLQRTTAQTGK